VKRSVFPLWLALLAIPGFSQVTSGSLSGFVIDPSGKPVAGARLHATDEPHSLGRTTSTDTSGFYRLADLPPSVYNIAVLAGGFETATASAVRVGIDSNVHVDFELHIAGLKQSIEVTSHVSAVESDSSDLGTVYDEPTIRTLPLNRRDFLQLGMLTAGVLPPVENSANSTRGDFSMHVNGGREEFNNFLLDGVDNNDQDTNRYVLQPPVDSIQEFKIATNSYAAEYGRNAAGQVNVLTRSGSNEWHGSAYEYLRNRSLDWTNYFDAGAPKAQYIRNQFGAGLGGPVVRDRSFVFANFDGLRARQGESQLGVVPTAAQRTGDLSGLGTPVIDPFSGEPFPENRIPASRISPVASHVLDLYPAANLQGPGANFLGQPIARDTQSQFNARFDHYLTGMDQLTFRYTYGLHDLFEPFAEQSTAVPGFGDYPRDRGHNAMVHYQRTFSPRTANSLLVGLNRATRRILPENYNTNVNQLWGVDYLPAQARDFGYPSFNIAGLSPVGDATSLPLIRNITTYQVTEGLSMVRENHSFKLGGEVRNIRNNGIIDMLARGSLSFSGDISGSGLGDLLLGYPVLGIQSRSDNTQTQRMTSYNVYFQDDWKVRRNLTLNLGIRYEYNTPPIDPTNRMSAFDLSTMTVQQVGTNGLSRSGIRADWNNFAPRIGLAWTLGSNTVVRGGYGIFYDAGMLVVNSSLYFNPPYFNVYVFFPSAESLLTLNNPFPAHGSFLPPPSLSTLSPDITAAYMQHWNLNLQHEFGRVGTVTLAYAGSKGTHLMRSFDLNQPVPGAGDLADRSPYPQFSNIFFSESGANSIYHSVELSFRRPLTRSLALLGAYTFSKSIDDTSAFLPTGADQNFPQNSHNYRLERALSSFDMTHRVTLAIVQKLPGRNWMMRDFEVSSIVVAQSGQPFTPRLQFDNSNTGNTGGNFGSDRPNLVHSPALSNPTPEAWFDTSAFAIAAPYTFGNAGRNIVRGPGLATVDLSLARRFALAERRALQFQVQAFNVLNRTNFDQPQLYVDNPETFGRIFSAKPPRQVQMALRFTF